MEKTGGCICGAVRFRAAVPPLRVTICHCTWCQRRTGTAFGTEVVFNETQVTITGETIRTYRHISDDSGRWLDVAFCGQCGCNMGFTLEAAPGLRTLPAGTFDDAEWLDAKQHGFRHVYVRSRREWSDLTSEVEVYEQHFRD